MITRAGRPLQGRPARPNPGPDHRSAEGRMTIEPEVVRAPALEMRGITKRYPGVLANDHIDLDVRPRRRSTHCSARTAPGKTTLMNVLYGLARPDEGSILLDGQEVADHRPLRCHRAGDHDGPPALHARSRAVRRGEHPARRGDDGEPDLPRPRRGAPAHRRARPAVWVRDRSRGEGRLAVGRLAAAGRDPQGAVPAKHASWCSTSRRPS